MLLMFRVWCLVVPLEEHANSQEGVREREQSVGSMALPLHLLKEKKHRNKLFSLDFPFKSLSHVKVALIRRCI
jgi:hypothetical protein